jgi:hypothetical protein
MVDVGETPVEETVPECPLLEDEEVDPFLWALGSVQFFGKSGRLV